MPEEGATPRVAAVLTQLGFGGAERQTVALLRRLAGTDWAPALVVCLSEDLEPYGPELEALGYRLDVLPRRGSFDLLRLLRLRRLLRRERIELVHAVHLLASGYCALATRWGRGPRLLPTVRGTVVRPGPLRRAIYRRMFRRCPRTLVNSQRGARFLVEHLGAPAARLAVVPNGVDFDALVRRAASPCLRAELGLPEEAVVVGYVGKDSRVKNVPRFLEIVRRLQARRDGLHAVLIGTHLDEPARARLAPDLPPARVHFLGPRGDVPALLAEMDALVLTSNSEGSPNIVLEALALGVPVVSSDVGDVAAMIPSADLGAVVPPADVDAYVSCLDALLARRRDVHAAAPATRGWLDERYGLDAMVRRTTDLWREVLSAQGRPRRPH
jgi:glycosyltransferase involved in cell wall biosynthesis